MAEGIEITNRIVFITGANRGIGASIMESFIQNGAAKVYAAVRNTESLAEYIQQYGNKIVPLHIDMSDPTSISKAAMQATDTEIVISNAGILFNDQALDGNAIDNLKREMEVNVYGLMHLAQAFAPILKQNGGGAFVQLNSVASLCCFPPVTTYSASKAAAFTITQGLRDSLQPQGTQVISVHPGPITSDMSREAGFADGAEPASQVAEAIISALKEKQFLVYTDTAANQIGSAYQTFAEECITPQ